VSEVTAALPKLKFQPTYIIASTFQICDNKFLMLYMSVSVQISVREIHKIVNNAYGTYLLQIGGVL
jgi:glyoxylate carboligase